MKGINRPYIDKGTRIQQYIESRPFPDNAVSNGASGLALLIPQKLGDTYTNAFVFAAALDETAEIMSGLTAC